MVYCQQHQKKHWDKRKEQSVCLIMSVKKQEKKDKWQGKDSCILDQIKTNKSIEKKLEKFKNLIVHTEVKTTTNETK